jgi:tape measure domain-containing protein
MAVSVDTLVTRWISQGAGALRAEFKSMERHADAVEKRIDRIGGISNSTSNRLLTFGAGGAAAFGLIGNASLKAYGRIQMAEIGFSKTLGSMDAARAKLGELREFDRQSPFSFTESVRGAQRLSAVGFQGKELLSVLRDIGDAAAGSGGGTEDFMGIARAIGQMRSKGKLSMEEINQLGDRGINSLKILQQQLKFTDEFKAKLMAGEETLSSDVAVPALLKGFREIYGGAMAEAAKTFPGQVSNLQSAVEQLGAALGEVLAKSGGIGITIENLTKLTDKTSEFVRNNPGLVKTGLTIAGIGVAGMLAVGGIGKLAFALNNVSDLLGRVTKGKKALEVATKADTVAEAAKTAVAGKEAAALGGVSRAADTLRGKTYDLTKAVDVSTTKTVTKLGLLARAKSLLAKPLVGDAALFKMLSNPLTSDIAPRLSRLTVGGTALSAGLGAAAGYGARDDWTALGDDNANAKGIATGVAAAAASMFIPGAAVPIAIATGFRYVFNELANRPMEREAESGGTGGRQADERAKSDYAKRGNVAKAAQMMKESRELRAQADAINPYNPLSGYSSYDSALRAKQDLETEAESRRLSALALMSQQRKQARAASEQARYADPLTMPNQRRGRARNIELLQAAANAPQISDVRNQRNGARQVTIAFPQGPGDIAQRNRRRASLTPQPRYA